MHNTVWSGHQVTPRCGKVFKNSRPTLRRESRQVGCAALLSGFPAGSCDEKLLWHHRCCKAPQKIRGCQLSTAGPHKGAVQSARVVRTLPYLGSMLKLRALRVKNALVRECMAEFLGTFVLLVSQFDFFFFIIIIICFNNFFEIVLIECGIPDEAAHQSGCLPH